VKPVAKSDEGALHVKAAGDDVIHVFARQSPCFRDVQILAGSAWPMRSDGEPHLLSDFSSSVKLDDERHLEHGALCSGCCVI